MRFRAPFPITGTLLILATASPFAAEPALRSRSGVWEIDPDHSEVRFNVTKAGFADVSGVFRDSAGRIVWDPANPGAASVRWRVRVASVLTDEPDRDRALQSGEYFDASRFPELTFASRAVRALADDRLEVTGDISIRGRARPLTIEVRRVGDGPAPSFETSFELNRYDFGVVGGMVLGPLIGRTIRVHLLAATREPGDRAARRPWAPRRLEAGASR